MFKKSLSEMVNGALAVSYQTTADKFWFQQRAPKSQRVFVEIGLWNCQLMEPRLTPVHMDERKTKKFQTCWNMDRKGLNRYRRIILLKTAGWAWMSIENVAFALY